MSAASSEQPKLRRYDAMARGFSNTCVKSLQPMLAVFMTSAASGINTMAHRKNVENPSVRPKPGRIEGCRKEDFFIVIAPSRGDARMP
jgi:hypothetical protein